jgi:hypothetical protein
MNDTVREKGVDEEEFLRQMRRDAVETYKQELVDEIETRMEKIKGPDELSHRLHQSDNRTLGIIRGMTNVKSLIQSHVIKVR